MQRIVVQASSCVFRDYDRPHTVVNQRLHLTIKAGKRFAQTPSPPYNMGANSTAKPTGWNGPISS